MSTHLPECKVWQKPLLTGLADFFVGPLITLSSWSIRVLVVGR